MPLLSPCVAVREKPALPQRVISPAFYGTLGFTTGVHYSLPLAHILGKINPVHALQSYLFGSHFNIIFPSTTMLQWSFGFMFPNQKPTGISILPHACHMHYLCHRVGVRLGQWETRRVTTVRGLREGCCLSPILVSSLYQQYNQLVLVRVACSKVGAVTPSPVSERFTNKST